MNRFAQEWRFKRYPVSSGTRHLLGLAWGSSKRAADPGLRITARLKPSRSTCDFRPALIEDDSLVEGPIPSPEQFMRRICIAAITRGVLGALRKTRLLAVFMVGNPGLFMGSGSVAAYSETTVKWGSAQIASIRAELHVHTETLEPQRNLGR